MQRNAVIFHGTGGNPEVAWYPWLGRRLAERGYAVEIPHYPGLNVEPIATFLPKVLVNVRDDGHFGDYNQPYETFELLDRLID